MAKIDEDRRFAAELRPLWDWRHARLNHQLAQVWLNRAIRELLADILRREGLSIEAERLTSLAAISSFETAVAASRSLFEIAVGIDANRAVEKSVDAAILVLATRSAIETFLSLHPEREKLELICHRLRQLARAARRIEQESHRMFLDLADA
ncbi:MAG: hypothetical protein HYS27_16505 [Deltaproteobacteria bacterium]|nr:hypothetical protein [Deltaproteobacteria bacterium]